MLKPLTRPMLRPLMANVQPPLSPMLSLNLPPSRAFASSTAYSRQSRGYVYGQSAGSRLWSMVPAPVKSVGLIAGATATVFFIGVPILIIFGPPLMLGAWWYTRKLRRLASQLKLQRWNTVESDSYFSFTDKINRAMGIEASHSEQLARNRVLRAVEDNEQSIAEGLGLGTGFDAGGYNTSESIRRLGFTPVESIQHDVRNDDQMEVVSFGLVDKPSQARIATVNMVVWSRGIKSGNKRMRVEVKTSGLWPRTYVLEGFNNDDVVINVRAK